MGLGELSNSLFGGEGGVVKRGVEGREKRRRRRRGEGEEGEGNKRREKGRSGTQHILICRTVQH